MALKSLDQLLANWRKARAEMEALANKTPRIIGVESVRIVKDNFKQQGYDTGTGTVPWEQRSSKTNAAYDRGRSVNSKGQLSKYRTGKNSTYKGSVYSSSNPLLRQTRNLYNAVKYAALSRSVTIGVDQLLIPYAKKMNEGGDGVPARPYMPKPSAPPNVKMLKAYKRKIKFERDKAMDNFKR